MTTRKNVKDEISLLDLHDGIHELTAVVQKNIGEEKIRYDHILEKLEDNEQNTIKIQGHFDHRLERCSEEMKAMVADNHYTKDESRKETTKAITAHEKRLMIKLALISTMFIGSAIGASWVFLSKYGHVLLELMRGNVNG